MEDWAIQLVQMWDDGMYVSGSGGAGHLQESALFSLDSPGEVFRDLFQANPAIENIPKRYSSFTIGERRRIIGTIIATQKGKEWWYFLRHWCLLVVVPN